MCYQGATSNGNISDMNIAKLLSSIEQFLTFLLSFFLLSVIDFMTKDYDLMYLITVSNRVNVILVFPVLLKPSAYCTLSSIIWVYMCLRSIVHYGYFVSPTSYQPVGPDFCLVVVVHIQCSKLLKHMERTVLSMVLCTIKNL